MKIRDVILSYLGVMTLKESDEFVSEMANFLADVTELPGNIVLCTDSTPHQPPHSRYRMKVYKDRVHCATYQIKSDPDLIEKLGRRKYHLDSDEDSAVRSVIADFASLFIQYVDGKMTANDVKQEIKRIHGGNK